MPTVVEVELEASGSADGRYRRTRERMPAHDFEVKRALEEGVLMKWPRRSSRLTGASSCSRRWTSTSRRPAADRRDRKRSERTGNLALVDLSVVVPVYGCADCLEALNRRVTKAVADLTDDWELLLVDDRSLDKAWPVIESLAEADPRVRGLRMSRNFGQHAAITAGIARARGDRVVVMDCDLQEPPEAIPELWAQADAGAALVRTVRRDRHAPPLKRLTSRIYRKLTLGGAQDLSTLSLLTPPLVSAFLALDDRDREYMTSLAWLGFDGATVAIEHSDRHAGESSYTLGRLFRVALDGIFFRTTALLHAVVLTGLMFALLGLLAAAYLVIDHLTRPGAQVPGYTSLAVLVLVMSGAIIIAVGVVGLYVGRVFEQVKGRPLYIVEVDTADRTASLSRPPATSSETTTRSR
jgi:polyisoprenyl-phosphate glycosyltransferase